ncbi:MAG: RNA polymerase sigma factor [Aeoliella sp.]
MNDDVPSRSDCSALSDQSLLRRFREGEQDAATALYVRYAQRLQALAKKQTGRDLSSRFDPEDVVQSVFRTFFRRAAAGYYEVPQGDELWRLLLVLALHKVRNLAVHHRAQKRDVAKTWNVDEDRDLDHKLEADDQVAYDSLRMVIDDVVRDLPASNQKIIEMRIEGHGIKEIAVETNRSNRTVERTLQAFREQLAQLVHSEEGDS